MGNIIHNEALYCNVSSFYVSQDVVPSSAKSAWRTPPSSGGGSHHNSQNDRPPSSSSSSKSRGHSRHSQRILAARFSGLQTDTDTTQTLSKARPPSGHRTHGATHSHLESAEYSNIVRQKAMMDNHNPSRATLLVTEPLKSSGLKTSIFNDSRSSEGIGGSSLTSSMTSGVSSLSTTGIDDSISFISTGPKTGYNRHHGGQPDSLPKADRLTPHHVSSNVLGMTKEPSLTHKRPLFDKNTTDTSVHNR